MPARVCSVDVVNSADVTPCLAVFIDCSAIKRACHSVLFPGMVPDAEPPVCIIEFWYKISAFVKVVSAFIYCFSKDVCVDNAIEYLLFATAALYTLFRLLKVHKVLL